MSLFTCIEPPNQAAIAYSMALADSRLVYRTRPLPPVVTTHRRLWPLTGLSYWQEWSHIVLVNGQGR